MKIWEWYNLSHLNLNKKANKCISQNVTIALLILLSIDFLSEIYWRYFLFSILFVCLFVWTYHFIPALHKWPHQVTNIFLSLLADKPVITYFIWFWRRARKLLKPNRSASVMAIWSGGCEKVAFYHFWHDSPLLYPWSTFLNDFFPFPGWERLRAFSWFITSIKVKGFLCKALKNFTFLSGSEVQLVWEDYVLKMVAEAAHYWNESAVILSISEQFFDIILQWNFLCSNLQRLARCSAVI